MNNYAIYLIQKYDNETFIGLGTYVDISNDYHMHIINIFVQL